jgi:hypothetical protein
MQDHHQVAAVVFLLLASGPARAEKPAPVKLVPKEAQQRVEVLVDGKPFTEYRFTKDVKKPVLFPIRTAEGGVITRGWPVEPRPDESTDHPHHVGFWFNYGDVEGIDFWGNSEAVKNQAKKGTIVHRKIEEARGGSLVVRSEWLMPDGKPLVREQTRFLFAGGPGRRVIDRLATLEPVGPAVAMPDTKEGTLGLRVARSLEHPDEKHPKGTGRYHSSEGLEGEAVWGTRARWVMLTGTLDDGKPVTIALFDRPGNPGFPTYWHARPWGLFAANPLGQKALSKGKETLNWKLTAPTHFDYRLLILSRQATPAEIEAEYQQWAGPPAKKTATAPGK